MKKTALARTALFLLLLFIAAAQDAFAWQDNARQAREEVEGGGWLAAYSTELTEHEAGQGLVAPGLSIFARRGSRDMEALHGWADELVRQAAAGLQPAASRAFNLDERLQARRFTVRTVRELLRARQTGSEQLNLRTVEIKVGVLEYQDRSRSWERRGGSDAVFVPYVALREKQQAHGFGEQSGRQEQQSPLQLMPESPAKSRPQQPGSADVLNSLALTNSSRPLNSGQWEWTAWIDGPALYLNRIRSVTYYLHPTFSPSVRLGDSSRPGHPLTAVGWGVFELKADVVLNDGTRRAYRHMLRFR